MKIKCHKLVSIYQPNGSSIRNHTHKYHELVYCIEGNGTVQIENNKSEFSTGNYYITAAGTVHTEANFETTRIIYFYFDAPREYITEGNFTDYHGSVLSCVKQLQRESETERTYKDMMVESLITRILIEARRSSEIDQPKDPMASVLRYVDENIEQEIDFRRLAEQQHYSFDRFRHIFKDRTGLSPHQYVIRARIEKAKFLLKLNPDASLTEVSFSCGFSSSSHFTKAFRSTVGITPSEYTQKKLKSTNDQP